MGRGWKRSLACALVGVALLSGCRSGQPLPAGAGHSKQYPIRGAVVRVEPVAGSSRGRIVLKHEAIPNFMEAMTMSYPVEDPAVLGELHPGDRISATLEADEDAAGPTNLRLKDVVITGQAKPDYQPAWSTTFLGRRCSSGLRAA